MRHHRFKTFAPRPDELDDQWVERDEYVRLAVCNRKLVRRDQPKDDVLGLLDPATGQCYRIRRELLDRPRS